MAQRTQLASSELGSTGLDITGVGLGAWAIGGTGSEFGWGRRRVPLPTTAAANELLMRAGALGYEHRDIACVRRVLVELVREQ
jgi:aryl-alcohol dehydrogenase-like predicted oxidoreductase